MWASAASFYTAFAGAAWTYAVSHLSLSWFSRSSVRWTDADEGGSQSPGVQLSLWGP